MNTQRTVSNRIRKTRDEKIFTAIAYPVLILIALACLIPFWLIVAAAFTDNSEIMIHGYQMWPSKFSLSAFKYIFAAPEDVAVSYTHLTLPTNSRV